MDHHVPFGLPSKVFHAFLAHTGEGYYGDKSEAILSELIRHWIATTPAPAPRYDDGADGEEEYTAFTDADLLAPGAQAPSRPAPPLAAPATSGDLTKGYQWKQLFLPNGTELRSIYHGRSTYARVDHEQILCDGVPTSPSGLSNRHGCGTRNAWKTIWLRFPDGRRWQRADRCLEP
ncbi:hypothetical protein FHW83_001522 [Duganella sp. SG902]|uniref:hypothetical protein n=1 Tax=Duganella sp. SG902 TaxID=2587016 RepID=UPI00159DDBD3|nr:hypothetical protein [Duganella sp. SG902]NVM75735.1 hypothetical protein [Duganella sp. SG902]